MSLNAQATAVVDGCYASLGDGVVRAHDANTGARARDAGATHQKNSVGDSTSVVVCRAPALSTVRGGTGSPRLQAPRGARP